MMQEHQIHTIKHKSFFFFLGGVGEEEGERGWKDGMMVSANIADTIFDKAK